MQEMKTPAGRTLVLMRHAKAAVTGPSDHERVLAERGHADAADAGRWLAGQVAEPDHVLVSDAARAADTWRVVSEAAGWQVEPERSAALYAAGPESALDLIREVPADAQTVLVLGHNPTMAYLAEMLDDGAGDPDAMGDLVSAGFPTSSVTVFTLSGEWADLAETSATVVGFHVGRA